MQTSWRMLTLEEELKPYSYRTYGQTLPCPGSFCVCTGVKFFFLLQPFFAYAATISNTWDDVLLPSSLALSIIKALHIEGGLGVMQL